MITLESELEKEKKTKIPFNPEAYLNSHVHYKGFTRKDAIWNSFEQRNRGILDRAEKNELISKKKPDSSSSSSSSDSSDSSTSNASSSSEERKQSD